MGYYHSALKKEETLSSVTMWTNLESMMQSQRSRTYEDKYCVSPFTEGIENSQIQSQKNKRVVARGCVGNWEMLGNRHNTSGEEDK